MSTELPCGEYLSPLCGCCYANLTWDGGYYCEYCALDFDDDLHPSYTDPTEEQCSKCLLPASHTRCHWPPFYDRSVL